MRTVLHIKNTSLCDMTLCHPFALGGEPLLGQKVTKNISVYPKGFGGDKPAWVAFDRQVITMALILKDNIAVHTHSVCDP